MFNHIKKKRLSAKTAASLFRNYSSEIASAGQADAHEPQLMQVSAAITRLSPSSVIAPTGHSPSHAPQFTHASEIL